jgi:hypothetical protein
MGVSLGGAEMMAEHKRRAISGYTPLAIGCALASIPLAFADVYFLRRSLSFLTGVSENNLTTILVSSALAIVALALAALAGRFFEERERYSRVICIGLALFWFLFGLLFFIIRLFDKEDDTFVIQALAFLLVFIADGALGFLAGRELMNVHLHDFLKERKEVEELNKLCAEKITLIDTELANMRQIEMEKKALQDTMRLIDETYYSEMIPSRMHSLERKMRKKELLYGSPEPLYRRIGYDSQTYQPLVETKRRLFDNISSERMQTPTQFGGNEQA